MQGRNRRLLMSIVGAQRSVQELRSTFHTPSRLTSRLARDDDIVDFTSTSDWLTWADRGVPRDIWLTEPFVRNPRAHPCHRRSSRRWAQELPT